MQVRNIADVTTAVARGDLSRKITVDVRGEILELKNTINTMVDQLNAFAGEVTRVAREVGTEGKLGGQAKVPGAGGVWSDLTDNVNVHGVEPDDAGAKHRRRHDGGGQRRPVAEDHRRSARRDPRAEEHDQHMVDRLRVFADEVTRVAKEVGTEGKLGGQAEVPGVAGTWKGAHRQRERDGELAHRAGAQHRRRGHRGDEGRPHAADHRRSAGRAR